MWLTDRVGETYWFDPGAPCLELAHTGGPGWRSPFESLHAPGDLAAFLAGHLRGEAHAGPGLRRTDVDGGRDAPAVRGGRGARDQPDVAADPDAGPSGVAGPVTADDLVAVVALRDAIWAAVDARMARRSLPATAVGVINAAAAEPPDAWLIGADGRRARREPITVAQLAASFARDAVDLLTDPRCTDRLRQCGADDCFLVFVDTSRPGRRRWCSMERCGNRAKIRSFRHRSAQRQRKDTAT